MKSPSSAMAILYTKKITQVIRLGSIQDYSLIYDKDKHERFLLANISLSFSYLLESVYSA